MLRRVACLKLTDISEVRTASIIAVATIAVMMEAVRTSETSANFDHTTLCIIPEDYV
jgi:hypothetical protein